LQRDRRGGKGTKQMDRELGAGGGDETVGTCGESEGGGEWRGGVISGVRYAALPKGIWAPAG